MKVQSRGAVTSQETPASRSCGRAIPSYAPVPSILDTSSTVEGCQHSCAGARLSCRSAGSVRRLLQQLVASSDLTESARHGLRTHGLRVLINIAETQPRQGCMAALPPYCPLYLVQHSDLLSGAASRIRKAAEECTARSDFYRGRMQGH